MTGNLLARLRVAHADGAGLVLSPDDVTIAFDLLRELEAESCECNSSVRDTEPAPALDASPECTAVKLSVLRDINYRVERLRATQSRPLEPPKCDVCLDFGEVQSDLKRHPCPACQEGGGK